MESVLELIGVELYTTYSRSRGRIRATSQQTLNKSWINDTLCAISRLLPELQEPFPKFLNEEDFIKGIFIDNVLTLISIQPQFGLVPF
jgi:hypothetical protein